MLLQQLEEDIEEEEEETSSIKSIIDNNLIDDYKAEVMRNFHLTTDEQSYDIR